MFFFFFFTVRKGIVYGKVRVGDVAIAPVLISITRWKMHENAMDRVRGRDTQRVAGVFVWVSGSIGGVVEWNAGSLVSEEGVSHFLSEMSCGEVVAGSLLFPGRAFEFSSPSVFFLLSPPLFWRVLLRFGHFATGRRLRTMNHWNYGWTPSDKWKLCVMSNYATLSKKCKPHYPVVGDASWNVARDPQCTCHALNLSACPTCVS